MIIDYIKLILVYLTHRKLRTWLSIISIIIGISAVYILLSLGDGLKNVIEDMFEEMGKDKIIISTSSNFMSPTSLYLNERELKYIKDTPGVKEAGGLIFALTNIKYKGEISTEFVTGIPLDSSKEIIESMQNYKVIEGRDLKRNDVYKAVLGCRYRKKDDIFSLPLKLGDQINIKGFNFKVVGFLECIGSKSDDSAIIIPLKTAKILFNRSNQYDLIIAQVFDSNKAEEIAEKIRERLRKFRNEKENEESFYVQTSEQLIESFNQMFTAVQFLLAGLAAISIIVGGVGITNTMYSSVIERKRIIGIMKAIGARNSDILILFLLEAGSIGLIGGILGVIIGHGTGLIIERIINNVINRNLFKISFSFNYLGFLSLFSTLIGILAGTMPAIKAAKMNPIDAIRS